MIQFTLDLGSSVMTLNCARKHIDQERFIKSPFKFCLIDQNTIAWRSVQLSEAPSFKQQKGKMTEYEKLELLHSQLDELINGNQLPVDELKILQSFVEDIREKHLTSNKLQA